MRKIYSLVLMATMLLIGTNVWASVHPIQDEDDEAKVQINGGEWQYATKLKEAFDAVQPGQTAEIELLNPVNLDDHITMPATISSSVLAGTCQNITLNLNNKNITADQAITAFRLVKGTLNIEGRGTISKASVGSSVSIGGAVIVVWGAEDKTAANWSNLTIGKDVIVSITPGEKKGTGIMITDMSEFNNDGVNATSAGVIYAAAADRATKYGYCNYYYDAVHFNPASTNPEVDLANACGTTKFPLLCGAMANGNKGVQQGAAFGVKVTIAGTVIAGKRAIQINGTVNQKPVCTEDDNIKKRDTTRYKTAPYYKYQYPYINITSTAHINSSEIGGCAGIYASGYGVFDIAGEVYGATGVYLKASDVRLIDANIHSTCDTYTPSNGGVSGVGNAGGSAIAIESNDAYAGGSGICITGDTKVTGGGGYAIADETYKVDGTSTTSAVTIEGGTIEAGTAGAMVITDGTAPNTIVVGGTFDADQITVTHGDEPSTTTTVNTYTPDNTHTTVIVNEDKTIIVISQGSAPIEAPGTDPTDWDYIKGYSDTASTLPNMKWEAIEQATIASGVTVKLGELQIISGSENNLQQLTIHDGATLQVEHLMMNDYAQIIVEAGGTLIVKGKQGIVASAPENIILHASETAQATFLFHPEVTSNRHPNATVEFISNSITDGDVYTKQRFGIPTYEKLDSIKTKYNNVDVRTVLSKFIYGDNEWVDFGWINFTTKAPNLDQMDSPFDYYQMQNNALHNGTVVTMYGKLYGNSSPTLEIRENSWNGYANSYMAPIDGAALIDLIPSSADKSFHIYTPNVDERKKGSWDPVSNLALEDIKPMQAFLLSNPNDAAAVTVDYWNAVYTPITGEAKPASAPARRSALSNITKAKMIVRGEGYKDGVVLAQDDQFSAAFDNSYDCRKYMNEGINLYVSADEKMGIFATDNLENTYVGFQSVNGGTYTIEFTNVQGEELTLIDHETGARVLMVEGNTYEFTANGANDYRFEIVKTHEVATAIENAEAVKSAKGIYTITGQYVGEMNMWNSLPAGVYVIDGAKRVK